MECSGGRVGRACPFKRLQRLKARALDLFAIAGKMKMERLLWRLFLSAAERAGGNKKRGRVGDWLDLVRGGSSLRHTRRPAVFRLDFTVGVSAKKVLECLAARTGGRRAKGRWTFERAPSPSHCCCLSWKSRLRSVVASLVEDGAISVVHLLFKKPRFVVFAISPTILCHLNWPDLITCCDWL